MLRRAGIEVLADIRAYPESRKYPQFSKDHMSNWLEDSGIDYHHIQRLGGRRNKSGDVSPDLNGAWNNQSFHNYADYTLSREFREGIEELVTYASRSRTAYFCSERHPARCHRLIVSNWLAANEWAVKHIIEKNGGDTELVDHELGKWGAIPIIEEGGTVVYPEL